MKEPGRVIRVGDKISVFFRIKEGHALEITPDDLGLNVDQLKHGDEIPLEIEIKVTFHNAG